MYDYSPLWQTMREMGITTYRLIKEGIDKKTLSNLQHNKNVTVLTLEKLCTILNCSVENVVRIVPGRKRRGSLVLSFFFTFLELQKIRNITF